MVTNRNICFNDGACRHQIPCRAEPVVPCQLFSGQASYAPNFVGLVGLPNLLVSQQIACLALYLCS